MSDAGMGFYVVVIIAVGFIYIFEPKDTKLRRFALLGFILNLSALSDNAIVRDLSKVIIGE